MKTALKMLALMILFTGVLYPALITLVGYFAFNHQSQGSLIYHDEKLIGSELIAQNFTEDKYFWPRPSAVNYNPLPSGGSNLGPTSSKLKEFVSERKAKLGDAATPDLVYSSGSGIDPHITIQSAFAQIERISQSRNISKEELQQIIEENSEGKQLGFLGRKYVNVLLLNLELDSKP